MPLLHQVAERLLVALVNLVDKQQHGYCHLPHLLEEVHVLLGILHHVGNVEQHVGVLERRLGEGQHGLLQLVVGFEHARRVREDNLHVVSVDNAHNPVARGLRLKRGYAYTLAHELVHQRRLAHIGVAHYVYESCLMHLCHTFYDGSRGTGRTSDIIKFANILIFSL